MALPTEPEKIEEKKEEEKAPPAKKEEPPMPKLEAAGRRLERMLDTSSSPMKNLPAKVVRRWLGTSSGASGEATLEQVGAAAAALLDPSSSSCEGRSMLMEVAKSAITEPASMDTSEEEGDGDGSPPTYLKAAAREVEAWLFSLAIRLLWKEGAGESKAKAFEMTQKSIVIVTNYISASSISKTNVTSLSSGGLFPLLARLYRYQSLVATSEQAATMRPTLVAAHGAASLRRDVDTQATLLNIMLQDLLKASQVEQAQKLLSNSTFPDAASNNQLCRYLYHSGRIQALRLEYTSAFSNLSQCFRKAPTNTGLGFRIATQRLLVVVQLLMGEIPDRQAFVQPGMKVELAPYLAITQAVRKGDLSVFHEVVQKHVARLKEDETYTLISRLAHVVVKVGLRQLHVSYSRISLQDIADRLGLSSATSAEFVVSKAIRDGVLEATIYHKEGYVESHDLVDVYATKEPAEAFHRRIAYCLTTHNDAVRGMRYPPDAYKKQLEASRNKRNGKEDEEKTDEEKAQELEDEMDEDY